METALVAEFSDPQAEALPWERALEVIESAEMFWLSTVRREGRPHVAPLPAMWLDGRLHFCTGAHEQKAKNIEVNQDVALTTGTNAFRSGIDVVVEGPVARETGNDQLARLAALWMEKIGWHFTVGDGVFLDEGNPDHQAVVFALTPAKVLAFTKQPYSQTRYTF
ncbi:pyridoxamine 5'-phosphate oxidase family protein [Jiangella mangrovi]|uniref:General stress protein 26 n=1 Tax=Jiangella mangrovi TaxID=1524084 RepID=A0A7W9LJM1_9ACTN|nr:pyridoxamine 5'-phosphate oxidase family protein [Jiangella mangrovi]MBB5786177.1 general stress protein 26 [Jiangella mangrovi]